MGIAVLVPWFVIMAWTGTRELDTKVFGPGVGGRGQRMGNSSLRNICLSVPLSIRIEKFVCDGTDFREAWYFRIFRKIVEKMQVSLKSEKNNECFM
jgi:hypothetical protein